MLAIWGFDELSMKLYSRLSEKEREKVCFVVAESQQPKEMIGKFSMSSLDKLQLDKVEKLIRLWLKLCSYNLSNYFTKNKTFRRQNLAD